MIDFSFLLDEADGGVYDVIPVLAASKAVVCNWRGAGGGPDTSTGAIREAGTAGKAVPALYDNLQYIQHSARSESSERFISGACYI